MKKISARMWATLILIGFVGQLAWTIENMYFNVFLYTTISTDPGYISVVVCFAAFLANDIYGFILRKRLEKKQKINA